MASVAGQGGARELSLKLPIVASLVLHGAVIAAFILLRGAPPPPMPPIYHVRMMAAPPGPRAVGVVQPQPVAPPPTTAPPTRPETPRPTTPVPSKRTVKPPTKQATPTTPTETKPAPKTPAPTAGGGETGGAGADVANVNTGGIDFPYPGYLENIVRQVALRFHPSIRGALRAEVQFIILRDGTVPQNSIRLVTRSGVYSFDLEAQGAVEAAANARAFGALPSGFTDDALPVTFRFDPKVLR